MSGLLRNKVELCVWRATAYPDAVETVWYVPKARERALIGLFLDVIGRWDMVAEARWLPDGNFRVTFPSGSCVVVRGLKDESDGREQWRPTCISEETLKGGKANE